MAIIQELYVYPIKSLRGVRVPTLEFDSQGPRFDRQWVLVDSKNQFLTQRTMPQLARFGVLLGADIEVSAPDGENVDFGLEEREGDEFNITLWKEQVPVYEVSGEVSEWFSEKLAQKVRLVGISPASTRTQRFVDSRPLLVLSKASLAGLEERMKTKVSVARFRPNIVLDKVLPHAEDQWTGFNVGKLEFTSLKPCGRCRVTTIHPLTGEMGEEPLKTLATYRQGEKGINFGQYYSSPSTGRVSIGDTLVIK